MSQQSSPLTYEGILEIFRRSREESQEEYRKSQEEYRKSQEEFRKIQEQMRESSRETDRQIRATNRKLESLTSSIGRLVENMISGGNIVAQFQALGYDVTAHSQNKNFGKRGTGESSEIDWLLEDGDIAILVEVKTTLKTGDVDEHIEKIEKYRHYVDAGGSGKKHLVGAVAGAFVPENVAKYAHKCGLHVIVQSGEAFKILTPPEGFVAKKW